MCYGILHVKRQKDKSFLENFSNVGGYCCPLFVDLSVDLSEGLFVVWSGLYACYGGLLSVRLYTRHQGNSGSRVAVLVVLFVAPPPPRLLHSNYS